MILFKLFLSYGKRLNLSRLLASCFKPYKGHDIFPKDLGWTKARLINQMGHDVPAKQKIYLLLQARIDPT
jgi:hypothetical protein